MISKIYRTVSKNTLSRRLALSIILIGFTTWVHHVYGGLVYDTPYRIIVPTITLPLFWFLTFYIQYRLIKKASKGLKFLYSVIVTFLWIVPIGLIEGGYNHILKNIFFFTGVSQEKLATLFPPEFGALRLFEQPNDIIFEISGIIQFFIGLLIIYYLRKFITTLRTEY